MYRGTSPTIVINVTGENFSTAAEVFVTLEQNNHQITKALSDLTIIPDGDDSQIELFLTQKETLSFRKGTGLLQIRWKDTSDIAYASPMARIDIDPILLEGVI